MGDGWALVPITRRQHALEVLDLVRRAADYVTLEIGRAPDPAFVFDFFEAAPPGLTRDNLITLGLRHHHRMNGVLCIAEGYEHPTDWWIGLMLIDPAHRRHQIGSNVVKEVIAKARQSGIDMLKLAVLDANPRGRRFWEKHQFVHHRSAPALPNSDGHDRTVLKHRITPTHQAPLP